MQVVLAYFVVEEGEIDMGTDRDILRPLAEQVAAIAQESKWEGKDELWRRTNDRDPLRPPVCIFQLPWHELAASDELHLRCEDELLRSVEQQLRRTCYLWRHMRCDMVVDETYWLPLVVHDTGFGVKANATQLKLDPHTSAPSRHFEPVLTCEADIMRISNPVVTFDWEATQRNRAAVREAIGDLLPVEARGFVRHWFAPWDILVTWYGVQEALTDLMLRPELVHLAMQRLTDGFLARLDQWERLGLLSYDPGNYHTGSGGLGYCSDLPLPATTPICASHQWGCATAQILGGVSAHMHEEFALAYERRWLERFKLAYYGCCEPLHTKAEVLRSIPHLRKVSVSPWANVDRCVATMGDRYVLSLKPNPAVFAGEHYDDEGARRTLRGQLETMRGCCVEVVMKDVSTCRNDPQRLWRWCRMAIEEAERAGSSGSA